MTASPRPAAIALPYAERSARAVSELPGADVAWLRRLREDALARVMREGVPSPRVERWKYTNLGALAKAGFATAANETGAPVAVELPRFLPAQTPAYRMVFLNGVFRRELSDLAGLPDGATVDSLADLLARDPGALEAALASRAAADPFAALNTALMADGAVVRLAPGTVLERPLVLVFMGGHAGKELAYHSRNLIVAGANSRATVVELYAPAAAGAYWAQPVTDITLEAGAVIAHHKSQQEGPEAYHIATVTARVAEQARYDGFALATGAALARNDITVSLDGPGASCRLDGAFLARGRQHLDTTTEIIHASREASSREVYKGVLDDQGRGVFQGRIVVAPDAQKTDGHQSCKTLLLSDRAEIDTKPELEIYADDVKCSHGATAGEIDHDALFYLRARGIDEDDARSMLVEAFVGEVLDEIASEPVRQAFAGVVRDWLRGSSAEGTR
ncbi:MAG: Fe-S cluster assembly protein SufD [Alphaproteobacteria bacterium]|nr:MAG: Fe-S cluster assembly protein SufD [Alphaproteobacteria bacterium]